MHFQAIRPTLPDLFSMPLLRIFFHLFWIACCSVSLLAQTRLLLGMPLELGWLDGFVFGGTVFGYHFTHPNQRFRIMAWGMGLLGGLCFLMIQPKTFGAHWIVLAPVLFWLAYYGFQKPGNTGLRGHPIAKPLTIALSWAWVTVFLPTPPEQWTDLFFLFSGRAAFIFALALAYDLSDTAYDQRHGLKTLAGKLGTERTFALIYKSLLASGICVGINAYLGIYGISAALALLVSLVWSGLWLRYIWQQKAWEDWQKPLIDGLMVLQFLLVLLFKW